MDEEEEEEGGERERRGREKRYTCINAGSMMTTHEK